MTLKIAGSQGPESPVYAPEADDLPDEQFENEIINWLTAWIEALIGDDVVRSTITDTEIRGKKRTILRILQRTNEPMTQKQLMSATGHANITVKNALMAMADNGYVKLTARKWHVIRHGQRVETSDE